MERREAVFQRGPSRFQSLSVQQREIERLCVWGYSIVRTFLLQGIYMVIQCSDPICSAEGWCTTEDRMKAPPGDHLLPQCSVTQYNISTHKARFTQNQRFFHFFIARMDARPQVHLPAENGMLSFARDNQKGQNLKANSLRQCKGLLSWVTKARAAQCTLQFRLHIQMSRQQPEVHSYYHRQVIQELVWSEITGPQLFGPTVEILFKLI